MSNFRFQDETVDPQLITDIGTLNSLSPDQLSTFCGAAMDFLVTTDSQQLLQSVANFASEAGVNPNALKNTLRGTLLFLKGATKKNLTPQLLAEDLARFGLEDDKVEAISSQWRLRLAALSRTQVDHTFLVNKLVDIEWRFGATASSSELDQVGRTYLQLKLVLDKGNQQTESVFMELSLPQFYQFLQEMEKAKAGLDYFS